MNMTRPDWVQRVDGLVPFEWNEDLAYGFAERPSGKVSERLEGLNPFCGFAVALFSVEWMVWNWSDHREDSTDVLNFVEANWTCMLNADYHADCEGFDWTNMEFDEAGFDAFVKSRVWFVRMDSWRGGWSSDAERLVAVARHALGNAPAFDHALTAYLTMLEAVFPWKEGDILRIVPRDLAGMELAEAADVATRIERVRAFLKSAGTSKNPYLRTPEEMKAAGFGGEPYVV